MHSFIGHKLKFTEYFNFYDNYYLCRYLQSGYFLIQNAWELHGVVTMTNSNHNRFVFLFCLISEMDDNIEQIKQDLQTFLYHLRIKAEVSVVPLVSYTGSPSLGEGTVPALLSHLLGTKLPK